MITVISLIEKDNFSVLNNGAILGILYGRYKVCTTVPIINWLTYFFVQPEYDYKKLFWYESSITTTVLNTS